MDGPRHLRPVHDRLGLYFNAGHNGHIPLHKRLLEVEGTHPFNGVLLSAARSDAHADLRHELLARRLEAILDTKALELATPVGFERATLRELPWAGERMHTAESMARGAGRDLCDAIAKHAVAKRYSAVLSPSHFIRGADDPWIEVDRVNATRTRRFLDANSGDRVLIYYLLAIHSKVLFDEAARSEILAELGNLDIDGIWLRVHPFGYDAGPVALRKMMDACADLRRLDLPIIADKVGPCGLALLAFGSAGGICCGLTLGEKFDALQLERPRAKGGGGNMAPRVYLESLNAFISIDQAKQFFSPKNRTTAKFGCRDKACCRRGVEDSIAEPYRHFIATRAREISWLGGAPPSARAGLYMNDFLRPASDMAIRAAEIEPSLGKVRKQLADWREVLRLKENGASAHARAPKGRRRPKSALRASLS